MSAYNFPLLEKILEAIGLSNQEIDGLIGRFRTWLLDSTEKKTGG
jgi:hypothetical protein